ncbi:MAG: D-alanyl-D-alanine carboxypeptidase [Clostridiales bacterium]|nr:D-alanyl-D-alanine carboxypeptidase [Clostridiales bacterium]
MKRALAITLALCVLLAPTASFAAPEVPSQAAALLEATTGRVLYEKDAHARRPMASTTKVMTCLLALEFGDPDALVRIPDAAIGIEGSSMYLRAGETLSLRDLLYGLMLLSGNDAAVAIAMHISGSLPDFAALMNARAAALGCQNTNFVTPNGLPDPNHYTTAYDLALICAAAMQNESFKEIVGTLYHTTTTGAYTRNLKNKNRILWEYEGANGIKTGFTKAAGKCLTFAAKRGNLQLVGAVLASSDMWGSAKNLLRYGFDQVEMQTLVDFAGPIATITVLGSEKTTLEVYAAQRLTYPIRKDGTDVIRLDLQCADNVLAPVYAGQTVGRIYLFVNEVCVLQTELITHEGAQRYDFSYYLERLIGDWLS